MSSDDPAHCDEPMKLARLIPQFEALPELLVFRFHSCGHVETIASSRSNPRTAPPEPSGRS
jgi:hypothetical protein